MLTTDISTLPYADFLKNYRETLKSVFYERDNIEKFTQKRGFPYLVFRDIMADAPLSVAIETKYGGRGAKVKECLGLLAASSYESLPLSLTFGINFALFLEPVAKYGQESVKQGIFDRFLRKQNMGGLMITEPDFGSDALSMQTSSTKVGDKYHIKGTKHWQGLTGIADYWLMTSRPTKDNGELGRDIDFFICDEQQPNQRIIVEELYNNIGLYPIPYGLNKVDIQVPEEYKLVPETTGLKLMIDLLHRSRLQFPGMAMGFIQRLLDESIKHTNERIVGGKSLMELDQIKHAISRIQSAFTVCSAMCWKSSSMSSIHVNVASNAVEANSMKAYVTDLMQEASQIFTQLSGANGYREESLGARGIVDSRPFQIFEGSNEMLYSQIAEGIAKMMGRKKIPNLYEYLSQYELTAHVADRFKSMLNFTIDGKLPQRKLVDLGRVISRVVSAGFVAEMAETGFRPDLVRDCFENLKHEVSTFISSYENGTSTTPIEGYSEGGSWLEFC
ncbi:MAG: alkylation response protein AidB-like acyl-CoA dehydrogenase [Saprospiraceae bacterium]|jgi:alkylation response protein AidB-like acyl-CoA dehydrogenase